MCYVELCTGHFCKTYEPFSLFIARGCSPLARRNVITADRLANFFLFKNNSLLFFLPCSVSFILLCDFAHGVCGGGRESFCIQFELGLSAHDQLGSTGTSTPPDYKVWLSSGCLITVSTQTRPRRSCPEWRLVSRWNTLECNVRANELCNAVGSAKGINQRQW